MSELINNSEQRKQLLKHMILQLHRGEAPEEVKKRLMQLMQKIPYGEVVEVEQALIQEGLPEEEILQLCDLHAKVLEGNIDLSSAKFVPPGHPVDTLIQENRELQKIANQLETLYGRIGRAEAPQSAAEFIMPLRTLFNSLWDVDKHYRRKENLLFPYLEKYGITGPPHVMWGKHDETRRFLKGALEALEIPGMSLEELKSLVEMVLRPASHLVTDMIMKEEEILFPMMLDKLTDIEWYEIYRQTPEIGFCLYDPKEEWKPEGAEDKEVTSVGGDKVQLPTGSFSVKELLAIFNTLPVDITFVDKDDKVRYFSQGKHRIFDRNRSILGRDVKMCHPPASVHVVERIVQDFKRGKESRAPFWIQLKGRFIHIEYFALRDEKGEYLGILEVSQDLTEKRALEGEQRLLSYAKEEGKENT